MIPKASGIGEEDDLFIVTEEGSLFSENIESEQAALTSPLVFWLTKTGEFKQLNKVKNVNANISSKLFMFKDKVHLFETTYATPVTYSPIGDIYGDYFYYMEFIRISSLGEYSIEGNGYYLEYDDTVEDVFAHIGISKSKGDWVDGRIAYTFKYFKNGQEISKETFESEYASIAEIVEAIEADNDIFGNYPEKTSSYTAINYLLDEPKNILTSSPNISDICKEYLKIYGELKSQYDSTLQLVNDAKFYYRGTLKDLDGDNIPEMILIVSGRDADLENDHIIFNVYSFDSKEKIAKSIYSEDVYLPYYRDYGENIDFGIYKENGKNLFYVLSSYETMHNFGNKIKLFEKPFGEMHLKLLDKQEYDTWINNDTLEIISVNEGNEDSIQSFLKLRERIFGENNFFNPGKVGEKINMDGFTDVDKYVYNNKEFYALSEDEFLKVLILPTDENQNQVPEKSLRINNQIFPKEAVVEDENGKLYINISTFNSCKDMMFTKTDTEVKLKYGGEIFSFNDIIINNEYYYVPFSRIKELDLDISDQKYLIDIKIPDKEKQNVKSPKDYETIGEIKEKVDSEIRNGQVISVDELEMLTLFYKDNSYYKILYDIYYKEDPIRAYNLSKKLFDLTGDNSYLKNIDLYKGDIISFKPIKGVIYSENVPIEKALYNVEDKDISEYSKKTVEIFTDIINEYLDKVKAFERPTESYNDSAYIPGCVTIENIYLKDFDDDRYPEIVFNLLYQDESTSLLYKLSYIYSYNVDTNEIELVGFYTADMLPQSGDGGMSLYAVAKYDNKDYLYLYAAGYDDIDVETYGYVRTNKLFNIFDKKLEIFKDYIFISDVEREYLHDMGEMSEYELFLRSLDFKKNSDVKYEREYYPYEYNEFDRINNDDFYYSLSETEFFNYLLVPEDKEPYKTRVMINNRIYPKDMLITDDKNNDFISSIEDILKDKDGNLFLPVSKLKENGIYIKYRGGVLELSTV